MCHCMDMLSTLSLVNMAHKTSCFAGSAGGLAKNFATLVEILGTYAEVKLPEKDIPLQTSRVSAGV